MDRVVGHPDSCRGSFLWPRLVRGLPDPASGRMASARRDIGPTAQKTRMGNLRWPKFLRNIWLQNISFLLLALFSTLVLTSPKLTSVILAAMLFAAMGLSMVFERRSFCRYLCPVGGFVGIYSQTAPIELRVKDKRVCATCEGKPCYNGSASGYGCPWDVFPPGLSKNTECGLCLECLRTCPHDNIAVNLRPFSADLARPSARLDEAFKAFIMLGSAMIYAGILLGPWGAVKDAAYHVGTGTWYLYAGAFLAVIFVILPVPFAFCAFGSGNRHTFKKRFSTLSTALIPLGFELLGGIQFVVRAEQWRLRSRFGIRSARTRLECVRNRQHRLVPRAHIPARARADTGARRRVDLVRPHGTECRGRSARFPHPGDSVLSCRDARHALVAAMKRRELVSRLLIAVAVVFAVGTPLYFWLRTPLIHAKSRRTAAGVRMSFWQDQASRFTCA